MSFEFPAGASDMPPTTGWTEHDYANNSNHDGAFAFSPAVTELPITSRVAPEHPDIFEDSLEIPDSTDKNYDQIDPDETTIDGSKGIWTINNFFRSDSQNLERLGEIAAATMAERTDGTPYSILEIPCSQGRETWSIASSLSNAGIDYRLNAVDINKSALTLARQAYSVDKQYLAYSLPNWGLPMTVLDYFEETDNGYIQPSMELQRRVRFVLQDFRTATVSPKYDLVVTNHFLSYYDDHQPNQLRALVSNMAGSLRPGGILTHNPGVAERMLREDVNIKKLGLEPARELNSKYVTNFYRKIASSGPSALQRAAQGLAEFMRKSKAA